MDWSALEPLVREVDAKDACTAAHTARVALYTQAVAEAEGVDEPTVKRMIQAALLHDIGKVDVPGEILAKPAKLTDDEYAQMKRHTVLGHERLVSMGVNDELVLALVRSHHERIDGTGYPDRLASDAIPLIARWFAVIDTFDAMTSKRPYRSEVGAAAAERALAELHDKSGSWYFPASVARLTQLYRAGQLDWILAHLNDDAAPGLPVPLAPTEQHLGALRTRLRR
ncbi:MAG: HD domain-containing protein [Phycisphaerales bacterium]